jgi:hypothetical protein
VRKHSLPWLPSWRTVLRPLWMTFLTSVDENCRTLLSLGIMDNVQAAIKFSSRDDVQMAGGRISVQMLLDGMSFPKHHLIDRFCYYNRLGPHEEGNTRSITLDDFS